MRELYVSMRPYNKKKVATQIGGCRFGSGSQREWNFEGGTRWNPWFWDTLYADQCFSLGDAYEKIETHSGNTSQSRG
jgi:hypothetical protein